MWPPAACTTWAGERAKPHRTGGGDSDPRTSITVRCGITGVAGVAVMPGRTTPTEPRTASLCCDGEDCILAVAN
eukprot:CAMPEP_0195122020 /NCGR_PEP_ID=MMETSP0448-20130528/125527_1 /TAXON_ID=66468 /ORGANISM="Heterocapsa triquestra, Strain CCMP 448" /LENGTH=73 /DNA_ID=CAMNT_0040159503 /DNA_START=181 /DNA_END=399 /DNA_ORIENTATION=-